MLKLKKSKKSKGLIASMTETIASVRIVPMGASLGPPGNTIAVRTAAVPLAVMYHLDTNQGDATIVFGSALTAFVDCSFGWVATRMCTIAGMLGCEELDVLSISHFDKDHFYGVREVLSHFRPGVVLTPARSEQLDLASHVGSCKHGRTLVDRPRDDILRVCYQLFERNVANGSRWCTRGTCQVSLEPPSQDSLESPSQVSLESPIPVESPIRICVPSEYEGGVLDFGCGVTMTCILNGEGADLATVRDNNDSSLAWVLKAAGVNYYTAGDLEESEKRIPGLLQNPTLHIVKCGHHGSDAATSTAFLKAVTPSVAILQGSAGMYSHPTETVLKRLEKSGATTFSTGFYVDYGPRPIVCGGKNYAGDCVTTIWSDGVFSVYWMKDDGTPQHMAWNRDGDVADLEPAQVAALREHIPLETLTVLTAEHNKTLETNKSEHKMRKRTEKRKAEDEVVVEEKDHRVWCSKQDGGCLGEVEDGFCCYYCAASECQECRPKQKTAVSVCSACD